MMNKLLVILIAVTLPVAIIGCDSGQQGNAPNNQVNKPKTASKPQPKPREKVVANATPEVRFVYDPAGKRDPFVSLVAVRKPIAEKKEPLTPLQEYDLSQFRLIAAIIGKNNPQAMVEAPDGKPYILKKGVLIGKNNGVVVGIDSNKVVVEEKYYDFSGAVRKSVNTIEFPPKQGVN